MTYVRERWLENDTGQWLSVDPDRSEPRYSYAHNSPTTRTDPSGTQTGDVPKGDFKYLKAGDKVIIQQLASKDERQRDTLIDFLEVLRSEYGGQVALGQLNFLVDVAGDALQGRIEQKVRQSRSFGIAGEALVRALLMAPLAPLPAQFGDFAPDTTDELGEWANGFIHGIAQGLYSLLPEALVDSVIDFFEEMIREHTDIATLLSAAFVRFTHWIAFFNADELTPRQRGEFVGSALISEIALVFIVAGAVEAAVEVYEIGSDLIESTGFGRGVGSRARTYGEQIRTKLASRAKGSKRPVPQQVADLLKSPEARIAAGVPASAVDGIPKHEHMPTFSETVAKADGLMHEKSFVYRVQGGENRNGEPGS